MNRLSHALLAAGLTMSLAAAGQQTATPLPLSIEAQPMETALRSFAKQSGLQVIFATALTRDLTAPAVEGSFTPEAALHLLLKDSKLQFEFVNERTVRISDDKSADAGSAELEELLVVGVRFYQPEVGRAASKTDLPLLETPLSVSIVTSEQIEARGADSLEQAFRYSASVSSVGNNRRGTTGFVMRGFNTANEGTASLYVNGSRFPINSNSGGMEPYLYQSVELLKGPASVLYGQASPGGIVNMVSKLPTRAPLRSIKLQAGSWDNRQVNADFGGPLTQDGSWGYRLTGVARDSGTMIEGIPDDRSAVAAALSWTPTADTKLTLLGTYLATKTAFDVGKPYEGTILPNANGRMSRELFVGEPAFDTFEPTGRTFGYLFEHRFNETWQLRQNLLGFRYEADFASVSAFNRIDAANSRLINRYAYTRADTDDGLSVDTHVLGKWAPGRFEHTVVIGVDYSEHDFSRVQRFNGSFSPLDAYSPVYGLPVTVPPPSTTIADSRQLGAYFQDSIKFDGHWVAMLGARWDDVTSDDRSVSAAGVASPNRKSTADAFTKRIGLLYLFDIGLAPYLSYSESFQPVQGTDFSGGTFDPTAGVQYEAGIKFEPKNKNASIVFAAYELTRQDVLTSDLAHPGFLTQTGEVRARGVEVEGHVTLGKSWDLLASYGRTDAEVTKSNGADLGQTPAAVPESSASLWLDYHYRVGARGELSLGAGARYVGPSFGSSAVARVPSYTDYDFSARYDLERWRFAFNVKNLLDEAYISGCGYSCYYGDSRNVTVSAQYSW